MNKALVTVPAYGIFGLCLVVMGAVLIAEGLDSGTLITIGAFFVPMGAYWLIVGAVAHGIQLAARERLRESSATAQPPQTH